MVGVGYGSIAPRFLREDGVRTATANERRLLSLLRRDGPMTRAQLARATELTEQSIARLVESLLQRDLLIEGAPVVAGRGKPGLPVSLNSKALHAVGVSVMTDAVAAAVMDLSGSILARRQIPIRDVSLTAAIAEMQKLVRDLETQASVSASQRIGVGAAVTGYFIGDGARLNPPPALDAWALQPLDGILSMAFDGPVWIENDGTAAAIGEAMFGVGRRLDNFAYLYFSAGFGGGVVVRGEPLRGDNGNAGEFASVIPVDWFQPNLTALLRMMQAGDGDRWASLGDLLADFPADHPIIDQWLDAAEQPLNLVLSAISGVLDPGGIVLGGRLPHALALRLIERLRFTNPQRRGHCRPVPKVEASPILGDASAAGAAALPLRAAFFSLASHESAGS